MGDNFQDTNPPLDTTQNSTWIAALRDRIVRNKKVLLLVTGFFLLVLVSVFFLVSGFRSEAPSDDAETTIQEDEQLLGKATATTVTPQDGATNVSLRPAIAVVFSRELTEREKKAVTVRLEPTAELAASFGESKTRLEVIPLDRLLPNTTYKLRVLLLSEMSSTGFTTTTSTELSEQDVMREQLADDLYTAKWWEEIYRKYPWYDKLPISAPQYFIYFDTDREKVIGSIYPKTSSPTPVDAQVETYKQEIINRLKREHIPTDTIIWEIAPEQ